ncbi:MAG: ASKHA domain-containing protein [Treponema sp.]|jgi:uncharacterized 2Fe-2S/4Fe-4S cluster protein (DUF4445 family)|nr:ASKHA domain-containing protein [Treponema sp.]
MIKVTFLPANITVESTEGSSLLEAARAAGVYVETPCGGKGTCQKCEVKIIAVDNEKKKTVLICQTKVPNHPITVELQKSADAKGQFENFEDPTKYLSEDKTQFLKKINLSVAPAALLDGLSDADRFTKAFLKAVDCQSVDIPLNVLVALPEKLRENNGEITAYYYLDNNIAFCVSIISYSSFGIAVDIGTTTVALWLVDLETRKVLASHNAYNSQVECGLDVISRINYAKKNLGELKNRILKTINELIASVCKDAQIESNKILCVSLAGNTTMTHLLLGINPEYIRLSPYTPVVFQPQIYSAAQIGISVCENAPVLIAPAVGSYVGGDITSGLLCTELANKPTELILFIDIGTNGEIVLGNNDFIFACACSAGPAFEGGGIKHGVRAQTGAIERVAINEGKLEVYTIGGAPAIGICGSGIISAIAELFKNGIIDSAGKFSDGNGEYILCKGSQGKPDITISETDIENFVRAKGAIFSACQTMLDSVGMSFNDVGKVYVAGGFGRFLDLDDARVVGLLPRVANDKYLFLGNSSVIGAYLTLVSEEHRNKEQDLARKITYMDLSNEPKYMYHYTGALFLPHTDKELFE